jgi:putative N6-adenine-specific DNA methylase
MRGTNPGDNVKIALSATFGLEGAVSKEAAFLGFQKTGGEDGLVFIRGEEADVAAANVWLRTADRVSLVLKEFEALNFEDIYEALYRIEWDAYVEKESKIIVSAKSVSSKLSSEPAIQSVGKKAVIDRLLLRRGVNVWPEKGSSLRIHIKITKDRARLFLNTSGEGLHKRGYAVKRSRAPLRETLAAALILLSPWKGKEAITDPFCGGGTIPIEAAMIVNHIAPNRRRHFDAERWPSFSKTLWDKVRGDAVAEEKKSGCFITGKDIAPDMVALSRECARRAGVLEYIHFEQGDARKIISSGKKELLATNPPYGERLLSQEEAASLYRDFGRAYRACSLWDLSLITGYPGFQKIFGARARRNRKLYNGNLKTYLYQYFGEDNG